MRSLPASTALLRALSFAVSLLCLCALSLDAQRVPGTPSLSRDSAVTIALSHGTRAAIAMSTSRLAAARVRAAGMLANPTVSATYSKATPQYHAIVDLPLDFLALRGLRLATARSANQAAELRLAFERAAIRLDVDTSYTIAAAQRARAVLSTRNSADADSLLTIAAIRRSAGDASDLDVDVARISAGRARNVALSDSGAAVAAALALQQAVGLPVEEQMITLADSLELPTLTEAAAGVSGQSGTSGVSLPVAAAQRDLDAADRAVALERRSIWSGLSLQGGIENHDPTGGERGVLPTFGVSIPLPLFNQNQGAVAVAQAERDRARVELAAVRRESDAFVARARRELAAATERVARDRELVATANRVARLSLQAYGEGEYPLTTVLEAQRNARETLSELIDDLVAANTAAAALRLYTGTSPQ